MNMVHFLLLFVYEYGALPTAGVAFVELLHSEMWDGSLVCIHCVCVCATQMWGHNSWNCGVICPHT